MNRLLQMLISLAVATFKTREDLVLENLALHQQIEILQKTGGRPRATKADRVFWVALSKIWSGWRDSLVVFTPATVVASHRKGFKLFWTWNSHVRLGRPGIDPEVRELIRTMNAANPLWGAPRIHGELLKLGFDISQASVSRLLVRRRKPRSQTWRAFLDNHTREIVSCDFFALLLKADRLYQAQVPRPRRRAQRGPFAAAARVVRRPLPQRQDASLAGQEIRPHPAVPRGARGRALGLYRMQFIMQFRRRPFGMS